MRIRWITLAALVLAFGLLVARLAVGPLQHNLARVLANNAFSGRWATSRSVELLKPALALNCVAMEGCNTVTLGTQESILQTAREQFLLDPTPMQIITDSLRIPSEQFVPTGVAEPLLHVAEPGVLYGPGTLKTRLFVAAEYESCWRIGVMGKHDAPPPVELELWLDKDKVGTLSYGLGDESWEELAIETMIGPNLHILGLTFANDFLDEATGADRNAYIEYVEVSRVGGLNCDND